MKTYYKFMQLFWLIIGIIVIVGVTILGFIHGFEKWFPYYIFGGMALFLYLIRRYMLVRMKRFEESQRKEN